MLKVSRAIISIKAFLIFIFLFSQFGCIHIESRPASGRFIRSLLSLKLPNEVILNTWESEKSLWHLSSFRIESNEQTIYIDPVDIIDSIKADYIFITHSHPDHFSIVDLKKIIKNGTTIVAPKQVINELSEFLNINKIQIKPGEKVQLNGIICEAVPAYNFVHQKIFHFVGYIITINGLRFYHAGDTGFFDEMGKIININIAMVPIGTGSLAMTPKEAAKAINLIKPQIAIPVHYELNQRKAEFYKSLIDKDIRVEILEQGK